MSEDKLTLMFIMTNDPDEPYPGLQPMFGEKVPRTVYVKDGDFFVDSGGMKQAWGKNWTPVYARSYDEAKAIGQRPDFKFKGRDAKPFNRNGRAKIPRYHGITQAMEQRTQRLMADDGRAW